MRKFLIFMLCAFLPTAYAQSSDSPEEMVKSVTNEVIEILKTDPQLKNGDPHRAAELIQEKVLPHFNFKHMTALAMGQNWRKATPEQQKVLMEEFRTLLVRTYSTALTSYRNQTIQYKPVRMQPGDTDVTVRSEVKQPGGEPIAIQYNMEKVDGSWKVYDLSVAGVSLVTTYRETFNTEVRSGGVEGLIKTLKTKNQQLAAKNG